MYAEHFHRTIHYQLTLTINILSIALGYEPLANSIFLISQSQILCGM